MHGRTLTSLGLALALASTVLAPRPAAAVFGGPGDMFITGDVSNTVRTYGGLSGIYIGNFGAPSNSPLAIDFGATNGRALVGGFAAGVQEFDTATGAYIKTYGSGWTWSGIYSPSGTVLVASSATDEINEYNATTGAFIGQFAPLPALSQPSDMRYGPNGNLYVCTYGGAAVWELHPITGAPISTWAVPGRPNDIEFLNGEILVTSLGVNKVFRYDSTPAHNFLGMFSDPFWGNVHGIEVSPHNGHIYVVDGVAAQCFEFDPNTFALLNGNVLTPAPGDKVVDVAFRPADAATPSVSTSWGRLKALYK